jgi:hypothetical protein
LAAPLECAGGGVSSILGLLRLPGQHPSDFDGPQCALSLSKRDQLLRRASRRETANECSNAQPHTYWPR